MRSDGSPQVCPVPVPCPPGSTFEGLPVRASIPQAATDSWCAIARKEITVIRDSLADARQTLGEYSSEYLLALSSADNRIHSWECRIEERIGNAEGDWPGSPEDVPFFRALRDEWLPFIDDLRQERDRLEHEIQAQPGISSDVVS